jgi:hypothetical protein
MNSSFKNKELLISFLFFAISIWIATYIFLPYFAIGGIKYLAYDLSNPVNVILNIVIPLMFFIIVLFFANYLYKKALLNLNNLVLCIIQISIAFLLILALIVFWIMVIIVYSNIINWVIGYIVAFMTVINFLIWSVVSFKKITTSKKEKS